MFYTEVGMAFHILTIISVCCASCMIPEQGNRSFGKVCGGETLQVETTIDAKALGQENGHWCRQRWDASGG